MAINSKIDIFIQSIRAIKKKFFRPLIIATIASSVFVVILVGFILINYFSEIVMDGYRSLLYSVYAFQTREINKNSYKEDLKRISLFILNKRGVNSVWVSDKTGRCIFHTDKDFFKRYRGNKLPVSFYKSIEGVWRFDNSFPEIRVVKIDKFFKYRLSIPLYPYGRDDFDFILGIDADKYPYIFSNILYAYVGIIILILFLSAALFLPMWFVVKGKTDEIITQALILAGSLGVGRETEEEYVVRKAEAEGTEEKVEQSNKMSDEGSDEDLKVKEEVVKEKKKKETEKILKDSKKRKEPFVIKPELILNDFKRENFKKIYKEYPRYFIESVPFHSNSPKGYYVFALNEEEPFYTGIMGISEEEPSKSYEILSGIFDYIKNIKRQKDVKSAAIEINNYLIEKGIVLSMALLKGLEDGVEYTSMGDIYLVYRKFRDGRFKELKFNIPPGGKINDPKSEIEYAEIKFDRGDFLIIVPSNSDSIVVKDKPFRKMIEDIVDKYYSAYNNTGFSELYKNIRDEIGKMINSHKKSNKIPEETGYIMVGFL